MRAKICIPKGWIKLRWNQRPDRKLGDMFLFIHDRAPHWNRAPHWIPTSLIGDDTCKYQGIYIRRIKNAPHPH